MIRSEYEYTITWINGKRVAVVIDLDKEGKRSVTNDIENIAKDRGVEYIIYRDSEYIWDFWSKKEGYKSLAVEGRPTTQMDIALAVAKKRYL